MGKSEVAIFALVFVAGAAISGAVAAYTTHSLQAQQVTAQIRKARPLSVAPDALLGSRTDYRGNPDGPYTLVEFMDYQCPPCKRTDEKLRSDVLPRYKDKLRLTVRNLPLSFHKQAVPAAVAAEAAREQGRFWPVHDALLRQNTLDAARIAASTRETGLDPARFTRSCASSAKKVVEADVKQAASLKLAGTPSFVLCCPDGRVLLLGSLDQIGDYVQ